MSGFLVDKLSDEPSIAATVDQARELEALGYDGVFLGERACDPLVRIPVVAQETTTLQLGTSVIIAPPRSPMHVAYAVHDIQVLSGNRFVLGIGHQVGAHLTRRFSTDASTPVQKMREYIQALRAIWACWYEGEKLDFQGSIYRFNLMPAMFTPEGEAVAPPLWIAAVGPVMTRLAGEIADGIFLHPFTSRRFVDDVTRTRLDEGGVGRGEAGRIGTSLPVMVAVGADDEELARAREGVRAQVAFYASTPAYRDVLAAHGWGDLQPELQQMSRAARWDEMAKLIDDDMVDTYSCTGRPAELAALISSRWSGVIDRIALNTPGYTPRPELLRELITELRSH